MIGNSSVYTGSGSDTTVLANLQGPGFAYMTDDTGKIVTGPALRWAARAAATWRT